jgi:hypothetical protein
LSLADQLTAEALPKMLGVCALDKAEYNHVTIVAAERMRTRTKRERFAEKADGDVIVSVAAHCRQGHLVRSLILLRLR